MTDLQAYEQVVSEKEKMVEQAEELYKVSSTHTHISLSLSLSL